ncbi:baseplate J/gp47 family protein [Paenibacillus sp. NEAU-GSW1]|uniref:baseplate J/gp47 family protein n=1 Tax=Paenibacillus sp. NEAU-GSW1 TaxID=2682486 RepID=UPI0012E2CC0A|nr:baseplate J/gp47 family protein [Paenibacillus sp. NEAU-GSW1]MUT67822.1 baseplate J protein [Paenibacillus sp. NEAU-GSW1]
MYETETFEAIMQRMLARVPNDVDKREGSIIYDALAPAAAEMAELYGQLDIQLNLSFADTSSGEYLRRRAADFGVMWQEATRARRLGLFWDEEEAPCDVPIGTRFSLRELNYAVVERLETGRYELESETAGAAGNADFGVLLPVDYVAGLARAELSDVLIPGENDETDDMLRERFSTHVQSPGTSGNISDYMKWALAVSGVGMVQVAPLWDGPGTVKVVVLDSSMQPASSQLVEDVQYYVSPVSGTGEGIAPVGAAVTVVAGEGVAVNVSATINLSGTATIETVQNNFRAAVAAYLKKIAFAEDPSPKYVRIGSMLLDTEGVQDYSGLLVNDETLNVAIEPGQVAVLGTVILSE